MTDPVPSSASGTVAAAESAFRLMYRSHSRIPAGRRKIELGLLFSEIRPKNKRANVTGALLLTDELFVQTLEGDEAVVRDLFAHIEKDPRHDSVAVLETGHEPRVFSRWAMAKVAQDGEPDIPLIANTTGISPAASRGTTSEQDVVLDRMRAAARGDAHVG